MRSEVLSLCKELTNEYQDWEFTSGQFKNKRLKHTNLIVSPNWIFSGVSALAQPVAGIENKKIEMCFSYWLGRNEKTYWSFAENLRNIEQHKMRRRFKCVDEELINYIHEIMNLGIDLIADNYDLRDEAHILANLPPLYEDDNGIRQCIAKIIDGDFDFIFKFYNDEIIETRRPKKKKWLDLIIVRIPDLKKQYESTGSVFPLQ